MVSLKSVICKIRNGKKFGRGTVWNELCLLISKHNKSQDTTPK